MAESSKAVGSRRMSAAVNDPNNPRFTLYTRYKINSSLTGRIRTTLLLKTGKKKFEQVGIAESTTYPIFRLNLNPFKDNTIRILYSVQTQVDTWKTFGYVTESWKTLQGTKTPLLRKEIRSATAPEYVGAVVMYAEETKSVPFHAEFSIGIKNHVPKEGTARYLRVDRLVMGMGMLTTYTTPLPCSRGVWEGFKLSLRKVCNCDVDLELALVVEEVNESKRTTTCVGYRITSIAQLEQSQGEALPLELNGSPMGASLEIRKCELVRFQVVDTSAFSTPKTAFMTNTLQSTGTALNLKTLQKEQARNRAPNITKRASKRRSASQATILRKKLAKMGCMGLLVHDLIIWWQTQPVRRLLNQLPVRRTIVKTAMTFGSGVAAFFEYYGWIMSLNLLLSVLWVALVVGPHLTNMKETTNFSDFIYAAFGIRNPEDKTTAIWSWYGDYTESSVGSPFHDIVSHRSCCNGTYPEDFLDDRYELSRSYAWSVIGTIFLSFFFILHEFRKTYELDGQVSGFSSEESKLEFSLAVFGAWDHTCGTRAHKMAQTLGLSIVLKTKLKAIELADSKIRHKRTKMEMCRFYSSRLFFALLSAAFSAGAIVAVVVVSNNVDKLTEAFTFLPAIIVASINLIAPLVFAFCVQREKWIDPLVESQHQIGREFLLRVACVYTFYYTLRLKQSTGDLEHLGYQCIQDLVANNFLRLYITDCVLDLVQAIFWPLYSRWILKTEHNFDISGNVLSVIYRQLLVWTASPVCPILPLFAFVGTFLTFIWRSFSLQKLSSPSTVPWATHKAHRFFAAMTLATCFVGMAPQIHFLYSSFAPHGTDTRFACGPHIDWRGTGRERVVLDYLIPWDKSPEGVRFTISLVFHPVTLILVFMVLFALTVFTVMKLLVTDDSVKALSSDLDEEHHDKVVLLKNAGVEF
eukprot:c13126_g1_i1.p1 GENE.c13126_g1_i1~~c13126_g1_i1.p1  ORF type:complete len:1031 (-),score=182.75 c13126_g1_i1:33-2786(-)